MAEKLHEISEQTISEQNSPKKPVLNDEQKIFSQKIQELLNLPENTRRLHLLSMQESDFLLAQKIYEGILQYDFKNENTPQNIANSIVAFYLKKREKDKKSETVNEIAFLLGNAWYEKNKDFFIILRNIGRINNFVKRLGKLVGEHLREDEVREILIHCNPLKIRGKSEEMKEKNLFVSR